MINFLDVLNSVIEKTEFNSFDLHDGRVVVGVDYTLNLARGKEIANVFERDFALIKVGFSEDYIFQYIRFEFQGDDGSHVLSDWMHHRRTEMGFTWFDFSFYLQKALAKQRNDEN